MKRNISCSILLFFLIFISGCSSTRLIRTLKDSSEFPSPLKEKDFIKIHLKDGSLYVLNHYFVSRLADSITGYGALYDFKRHTVEGIIPSDPNNRGTRFSVSRDKIALLETNKLDKNLYNLGAISIVGVPIGLFTIYCLTNPKACFGSCPTFYALKNNQWKLVSEGFSSSISPVFEKRDVDILHGIDETADILSIKLTNEAMETHVIRYVDLLALPVSGNEGVYATKDCRFYRTSGASEPLSCIAEEGDCTEKIRKMDGVERYCGTDSTDLSRKEEIFLEFSNRKKSGIGLLIGSKQTLLTTFLFYQAMALSGNHYGQLVSEIGTGNKYLRNRFDKIWEKLGGIEVFIRNEKGGWEKVDEIDEMGPIASDIHLVNLPATNHKNLTVKIRMTKGLWRIDYLALAEIAGEDTPLRIKPEMVLKDDSIDNQALSRLLMDNNPLITYPGDKYELKYKVPYDCKYQFFIDTKGYYLEWMREEWLAEENLKKLFVAFNFPGIYMRKAAPEFKKVESQMEKTFWGSRYVKY
jgi:hypothetical protein